MATNFVKLENVDISKIIVVSINDQPVANASRNAKTKGAPASTFSVMGYKIQYKYSENNIGPLTIVVSLPSRWGVSEFVSATPAPAGSRRSVTLELTLPSQQDIAYTKCMDIQNTIHSKIMEDIQSKAGQTLSADDIEKNRKFNFNGLIKVKKPTADSIATGRQLVDEYLLKPKLKHFPGEGKGDGFSCDITNKKGGLKMSVTDILENRRIMWNSKVCAVITIDRTYQAVGKSPSIAEFMEGKRPEWGITTTTKQFIFNPTHISTGGGLISLAAIDPEFTIESDSEGVYNKGISTISLEQADEYSL